MLDAARVRLAEHTNVDLREGDLTALPIDDASVDAAICLLVLHHLEDPAAALSEARRVLRPGSSLVVLDVQPHDREEYRRTMGHRHLGFSPASLREHAVAAGLRLILHRALPPEPDAQGPPLFVAVLSSATPERSRK